MSADDLTPLHVPPCSRCGNEATGLAALTVVDGKPAWTCEGCDPAAPRARALPLDCDEMRRRVEAAADTLVCPGVNHMFGCGEGGTFCTPGEPVTLREAGERFRSAVTARSGDARICTRCGGITDTRQAVRRGGVWVCVECALADGDLAISELGERAAFERGVEEGIRREIGDEAYEARRACDVCSGRAGADCTCAVFCGDCRCEQADARLTAAHERGKRDGRREAAADLATWADRTEPLVPGGVPSRVRRLLATAVQVVSPKATREEVAAALVEVLEGRAPGCVLRGEPAGGTDE